MVKFVTLMVVALSLALGGWAGAQCHGNGGNGRISHTPLAVGSTVVTTVSGSPAASYLLDAGYIAQTSVPMNPIVPGVVANVYTPIP